MKESYSFNNQIQQVTSFEELVSFPYLGSKNAVCWRRELIGDFSEIVRKFDSGDNITEIFEEDLKQIELSDQGSSVREIILNDFKLLSEYGASPSLNVIQFYEEDETNSFFPTDVYSFHVDRSPIPSDTFLCTYIGESSDILPNEQAIQKVLIPEIANELKNRFQLKDSEFEEFIQEHFFDLHYQPLPNAKPINLGNGHIWKLAVDHPQLTVQPCIHRAPREKNGQKRLLMIC